MVSGFLTYLSEKYQYYAKPEGEDPVGKLVGLGQYGFLTGSFIAVYDAVMWSHCANAPQFLNTFGYWVVPLTGVCVAYAGVTYTLTNLRKKDDKFNVICGAIAAGGVLHAWQKCYRITGWGTAFMVLYAVLKKQHIQEGKDRELFLTPYDEFQQRKTFVPWRNDPDRNFSSKPWYPHDKTDYYRNHY